MTKIITYKCNLCSDQLGNGYGLHWVGNKLILQNDVYSAKQSEHHICINCANSLETFLNDENFNKNVNFGPAWEFPKPTGGETK